MLIYNDTSTKGQYNIEMDECYTTARFIDEILHKYRKNQTYGAITIQAPKTNHTNPGEMQTIAHDTNGSLSEPIRKSLTDTLVTNATLFQENSRYDYILTVSEQPEQTKSYILELKNYSQKEQRRTVRLFVPKNVTKADIQTAIETTHKNFYRAFAGAGNCEDVYFQEGFRIDTLLRHVCRDNHWSYIEDKPDIHIVF